MQPMSCHVQISCHCTKEPCHSRPFLVAFVRHGRQSRRLFPETVQKFLQCQVYLFGRAATDEGRHIASIKLQESECVQLVRSLCGQECCMHQGCWCLQEVRIVLSIHLCHSVFVSQLVSQTALVTQASCPIVPEIFTLNKDCR